ncbi:hypothetical protein ACFWGI_35560 [Streptomyces niveus]|uniref:hypothetical protein n=1 Tax=Streptomyces niveus TaxID=193462 RepID=UPI00364B0BA1
MARTFRAAEVEVCQPHGDEPTPSGHVLAVGPDANDPQGIEYLLLYCGSQPSDAGLVGSISIPRHHYDLRDVYDRAGQWIGLADRSLKTTLANLVNRTTEQ